ncbi:MAG: DUF3240 family protein [Gammaproteobacteria bacterium]|nr:DUF3240 family protein [Gammaproteobacteria bacterium]MBI5616081.1 DUF3240 family protein [Gammaproteobacteria bacterium]
MADICLMLICPPPVAEGLLDLLLMHPKAKFFMSAAIAAHDLEHEHLDQLEQVMGRADATLVQIVLTAADKDALLDDVRRGFPRACLRYWIVPVVESGELS